MRRAGSARSDTAPAAERARERGTRVTALGAPLAAVGGRAAAASDVAVRAADRFDSAVASVAAALTDIVLACGFGQEGTTQATLLLTEPVPSAPEAASKEEEAERRRTAKLARQGALAAANLRSLLALVHADDAGLLDAVTTKDGAGHLLPDFARALVCVVQVVHPRLFFGTCGPASLLPFFSVILFSLCVALSRPVVGRHPHRVALFHTLLQGTTVSHLCRMPCRPCTHSGASGFFLFFFCSPRRWSLCLPLMRRVRCGTACTWS